MNSKVLGDSGPQSSESISLSTGPLTSLPQDPVVRKHLGAWYTPESIIRLLVQWALRSAEDVVLDPAVGDGGFLREAANRLRFLGSGSGNRQLYGLDINPSAISTTQAELARSFSGEIHAILRVANFFHVVPPQDLFGEIPQVDAVVGNPPYVRYQHFAGATRAAALGWAAHAGVRLSGLSSSWAPFVAHAASFLRPGGRLAFVLPEELSHASYARAVRSFLRARFRRTTIVSFNEHLFPSSQERIVLMLAEGKDLEPKGELRLCSARDPEGIVDLNRILDSGEALAPAIEPAKWEVGHDDPGAQLLATLTASGELVPLSRFGKAGIGYVSGANDYFILRKSDLVALKLPRRALRKTIIAARQVPGAVFSIKDFRELSMRDERCMLWDGGCPHLRPVRAYIERGRRNAIHQRYKCRMREPWFRVPGIVQPEAFLTYMSDRIPRLVLNRARTACSNNLLAIRLPKLHLSDRVAIVAAFYNSATMLAAEVLGRRYGGGVLKLEPSEADRLLLPAPRLLKDSVSWCSLLKEIDQLLRAKKPEVALQKMDSIVLSDCLGLSTRDIRHIQDSHLRRRRLRLAGWL